MSSNSLSDSLLSTLSQTAVAAQIEALCKIETLEGSRVQAKPDTLSWNRSPAAPGHLHSSPTDSLKMSRLLAQRKDGLFVYIN
jgi:hypothetical protein